jgi:D-glycero-D-manno-heptose 1,7-bisphosphate phosphatase
MTPPCLSASQPLARALILDRDGTLIEHVPYLHRPEEVRLLPTVQDALRKASAAGVTLHLHTNQSGIGRGLFSLEQAESCTARMVELLDLGPAPFLRICMAPEAPNAPAIYRKPAPRFASEIIAQTQTPAHRIAYIGDRGSDLETARNAGTLGIGVATGLDDIRAELTALGLESSYPVFDSLLDAVNHFLETVPVCQPLS